MTILMWVAGAMTTAIVGLSGYFVSEKNNIAKNVIVVEKDIALKGERIATTEAKVENVEKSLIRIESKLDTLLSKQGIFYVEKK